MIAFYYGLTGYACTIYYRKAIFRNVKAFFLIGVLPLLGGVILTAVFIKSCIDLSDPANSESGDSWLGRRAAAHHRRRLPALGAFLMVLWYAAGHREFFRRKPETAPRELIESAPAIEEG